MLQGEGKKISVSFLKQKKFLKMHVHKYSEGAEQLRGFATALRRLKLKYRLEMETKLKSIKCSKDAYVSDVLFATEKSPLTSTIEKHSKFPSRYSPCSHGK